MWLLPYARVLCTCRFISEFLGSLHSDTRKALAAVARLEVYKKDQVSAGSTMRLQAVRRACTRQGTPLQQQPTAPSQLGWRAVHSLTGLARQA